MLIGGREWQVPFLRNKESWKKGPFSEMSLHPRLERKSHPLEGYSVNRRRIELKRVKNRHLSLPCLVIKSKMLSPYRWHFPPLKEIAPPTDRVSQSVRANIAGAIPRRADSPKGHVRTKTSPPYTGRKLAVEIMRAEWRQNTIVRNARVQPQRPRSPD